jgi:hypothetical protein
VEVTTRNKESGIIWQKTRISGGADKGGFDKVSYLEEMDIFTCIIKMFRKSNEHTQTCIEQMAEYVQNGADCLELLSCTNATETES